MRPGLPRIVLIDPSDLSTSLAARLGMQGYDVNVVRDPAEGARLALGEPPAAVVADLWMPQISGVQLCRLLKAEPATESVPVILRGPDTPRDRFWAERAGASGYVLTGRMGDLVRALAASIAQAPESDGFFTSFAGEDIRDRIATHLDAALFESVLAADVRALGTCDAFDRLFDLFSQFVSRVVEYRWLAIATDEPARFALHSNVRNREVAAQEARQLLAVRPGAAAISVEDDDACDGDAIEAPRMYRIELGGVVLGRMALSLARADSTKDHAFAAIIAREIAGPIRMATLVEESRRLATVDALTGLRNRRAFLEAVHREVAHAKRYEEPLTVVLLDVDHFKQVNDQRGHAAGDNVLERIGGLLASFPRAPDVAARWGGEEFVVALPHTDLAGGLIFAERLRAAIEGLIVMDKGARVPVTASLGVARLSSSEGIDSLMDRADAAMYEAKKSGRNRAIADYRSAAESPASATSATVTA